MEPSGLNYAFLSMLDNKALNSKTPRRQLFQKLKINSRYGALLLRMSTKKQKTKKNLNYKSKTTGRKTKKDAMFIVAQFKYKLSVIT